MLTKKLTQLEMWEKLNKLSIKAKNKGEIPVSAIVLNDQKEIIAQAFNKNDRTNKVSDHAEIIALNKAGRKLKTWKLIDCTLLVTLEPCVMCFGAILNSRVKNVYFMLKTDKGISSLNLFNELKTKTHLKNFSAVNNLQTAISKKIIKDFFNDLRKGK